jgi:glycosyltransferase involved in cell wall biosynthesis
VIRRTRLAVALATYNGAKYLPIQLKSILSQTRPPDEIVVSDDGSTDDTLAIVEDVTASSRVSIQILHGPGRGLAENFWHALQATDCDLVAWSDQDDIWYAEKLAASERALVDCNADLVSHSARVVNQDAVPTSHLYPHYRSTNVREALQGDPWHVPSGFATTFRRSVAEGIDFAARPISHQTHRAMNHDHVISLAAFVGCRRVELSPVLASYRQHESNAAGDPSVRGRKAIHFALQVGTAEYEALADITDAYAVFVASLTNAVPGSAEFFQRCAERIRRRGELYAAQARSQRVRSLVANIGKHDYGHRKNGQLSLLALARDAVQVAAR